MLYLTTRDKTDAFTAYRALCYDRGKCGGLYVPYSLPHLCEDSIRELQTKSFGQRIADILNLFFRSRLSSWDVDFAIGRYPVRLSVMNHKIVVAETWHNPDREFERTVNNLSKCLLHEEKGKSAPSDWVKLAVRIAILFGIFGELSKKEIAGIGRPIDVAVPVGDFTLPMAAWYAKRMGLPLDTIICVCSDNGGVWDLFYHGQLQTGYRSFSPNAQHDSHHVPAGLERLIFEILGYQETQKFISVSSKRGLYTLSEDKAVRLRAGFCVAVIRESRTDSVIRNVYRTNTYLLDPQGALAYAGLRDYRASKAETGAALILSESSPDESFLPIN